MSESSTPPEILGAAAATIDNLLPQKSKDVYEHYYQQFMDLRTNKKCANSFSENVIMAYFSELSNKMKDLLCAAIDNYYKTQY